MSVTRVGDPMFDESILDRFRADPSGTWYSFASTSIRWSVGFGIGASAFVLLGLGLGTNPIPASQAAGGLALALLAGAVIGCFWELIPRTVTVTSHHLVVVRNSVLRYWPYDRILLTPSTKRPDLFQVSCDSERWVLTLKAKDIELFRLKLRPASSSG